MHIHHARVSTCALDRCPHEIHLLHVCRTMLLCSHDALVQAASEAGSATADEGQVGLLLSVAWLRCQETVRDGFTVVLARLSHPVAQEHHDGGTLAPKGAQRDGLVAVHRHHAQTVH